MHKVNSLVRLALGFIALVSTSAPAQTYLYTYTGNDFTSASGPYTTSDKVTGSITFSAPLGDNYEGNPSATILSFIFTDGVGPQNVIGGPGGLVDGRGQVTIFGTDLSGAIVSWNFEVLNFLPPNSEETKGIQTENDSGNVVDSGNLDESSGIVGEGSVSANPGVWVETIVPAPEPSAGLLFVSFTALVLASSRFKPSPSRPHPGSEG
jgi:hypothetical protein